MPYMTVEQDPIDTFFRFVENCSDEEVLATLEGMLNDMLEINNHQKQMDKLDENLYSGDRAEYAIHVMNFDMDRVRFASEKVSAKISYMNEMKLREMELKHGSEAEVESQTEDLGEKDVLTDEERKEDKYEPELPASASSLSELAQQITKMPEFEWKQGMEVFFEDSKHKVALVIDGKAWAYEQNKLIMVPEDGYVSLSDPATKGILLDFARKLTKRPSLFITPPGAFSAGWGYAFAEPRLSYPKNSFKSSEEEALALIILNYKNYLY